MKMFFLYSFIGFLFGYLFFRKKNLCVEDVKKIDNEEKDFSHAVIHELRAYLTNLNWIFEKLLDKGLGNYTEEQYSAISSGRGMVENANNLVNDTLNAISVGRTEARFKYKLNDINKLIEDIISEYSLISKERKISLSFVRSSMPIPLFFFDNSQMYIAIHDLVHNSMKYTHDGGKVSIKSELLGEKVKITIEDNGIGIPSKDKNKIFTKFFRADNAKKIHGDGSGLGLYISKNIIKKHKGDIEIFSEEGRGTKVEITLPLVKTEPKDNLN